MLPLFFALLFSVQVASLDTKPQQVHLAYATADTATTGMSVSWFTVNNTLTSTVKYGTSSGVYSKSGTGISVSYYENFHHHVVLGNLAYNTKYYYVCGDDNGGWSSEFSFTTKKKVQDVPLRIAVLGDMGITNSDNTRNYLQKELNNVEFYLHVGDASYADDREEKLYEEVWNTWFTEMEPIMANKPYMVCPGNHEATCSSSMGTLPCHKEFLNFTAYRHRFRMPAPESGSSAGNMWYSYNVGPIHFVSISTETDYRYSPEGRDSLWNAGPFGPQLQWLEQDLQMASQQRNLQPWLVVVGHRPLYTSTNLDFPPLAHEHLRDAVEDLFLKYKVDLYLCGHVHAYERMYPIAHDKIAQKGYNSPSAPAYVVIGNAGNIEGLHRHWSLIRPDWLAERNDELYGYAILTAQGNSSLNWVMHGVNNTGNYVIDTFTLTK